MKKRIVVLPFDGYEDGADVLDAIENTLEINGLHELVAFIKLNDGLHNSDYGGPTIVGHIKNLLNDMKLPIGIFLDLKIYDVSATVINVLRKYEKLKPEILTVSSQCSVKSIIQLRELLPDTKLAMVSALTDMTHLECVIRFGNDPGNKIRQDLIKIREIYKERTKNPEEEPFDLMVCSPLELPLLSSYELFSTYGFIVPGIRDEWMKSANKHQERTTGIAELLRTAGDRTVYPVMGAQLTKGNPEQGISAEESCLRTMEQMGIARM